MSADTIAQRPHWLFTSESAKKLSEKAVEARREKLRALQAKANAWMTYASNDPNGPQTFRDLSAARTREQMEQIQAKIGEQLNKPVLDSKVLKELTEALARLETIEQKLSGRASPGALRPRSEKASRSRPSEPEPMPESDQESPETT